MNNNPFTQHPAEVGESYWQHQRMALGFAVELFAAGFAALVHAFLPFLFVKTGSKAITRLHERMVINRATISAATPASGRLTAN